MSVLEGLGGAFNRLQLSLQHADKTQSLLPLVQIGCSVDGIPASSSKAICLSAQVLAESLQLRYCFFALR